MNQLPTISRDQANQANRLVAQINATASSNKACRRFIFEFYTQKCFAILGYDQITDCIESRLKISPSKFYRILAAAKVEAHITGTLGQLCEFTLRQLTSLDSRQQQIVWQLAMQQIEPGRRFPTAKLVRSLAQKLSHSFATHTTPASTVGSHIDDYFS